MCARILVALTTVQLVAVSLLIGVLLARPGATGPELSSARAASLANALPLPVSVASAQAQPIVPASLGVTLPEARVIVDAAVAYGRSVNGAAGIAVVDGAGNVVSLDRMD